ncbi:hypothetical protein LENED_008628 [Lentinula edodes]|uniref:Uncharacterized protein n=1 Tax=Lentinula edodes TaxID=5353 RepID=A0A1Q3EHI9_LENED|nr:hypothetical protein LENED_008628 [Lentinula edodes]
MNGSMVKFSRNTCGFIGRIVPGIREDYQRHSLVGVQFRELSQYPLVSFMYKPRVIACQGTSSRTKIHVHSAICAYPIPTNKLVLNVFSKRFR